MGQAARRPRYTIQDYVRLEEHSNIRHEFLEGEIFAMAGGTPDHSRIAGNLIALLSSRLEGRPSVVFTSDARVRVHATGLDTYPDVSVVCGRLERDDLDVNAIRNPLLLVEITRMNTEDYDRGDKLSHYQQIPSLREVLIVSHRDHEVEIWRRGEGGRWARETCRSGTELRLESLDCTLAVDAIYRDPLPVA